MRGRKKTAPVAHWVDMTDCDCGGIRLEMKCERGHVLAALHLDAALAVEIARDILERVGPDGSPRLRLVPAPPDGAA